MAPSSQELEPPRNPGRFNGRHWSAAIGQLLQETQQLRLPANLASLREGAPAQARHLALQHRYDALGNRVATTLPDGRTLNHLFYGVGHLHQINLAGQVVS